MRSDDDWILKELAYEFPLLAVVIMLMTKNTSLSQTTRITIAIALQRPQYFIYRLVKAFWSYFNNRSQRIYCLPFATTSEGSSKSSCLNTQIFVVVGCLRGIPPTKRDWELILENSRRFQLRNLPPSHQPADSARAGHDSHQHRWAHPLSACGFCFLTLQLFEPWFYKDGSESPLYVPCQVEQLPSINAAPRADCRESRFFFHRIYEASKTTADGQAQPYTVSDSHLSEKGAEWVEPPVRAPAPSYRDTPWSAVSSDANPVLATMRPLGSMPSAADMRKAGLGAIKPSTQNIAVRKDERSAPNGDQEISKPQTPLTPAEEPIAESILPKDKTVQDVTAFTTIPIPDSTDVDVEKLRSAVENALHMASETGNRPVIRGLLRLWETCGKDSFALSVLEGVCGANPGAREQSVFQTVMRTAWKEVQSEESTEVVPAATSNVGRTRSASSVSSLSSAKSFDAESFAPGMTQGAAGARARARGRHSKSAQKTVDSEASEPPSRRSAFPSSDTALQRRRALEENPEFSAEAVTAKRTRMQRSLPKITAPESRLRSSLISEPPSGISTPAPTAAGRSQTAPDRTVADHEGRSESPASSDAGDNRRLTPTIAASRENNEENNDFCRECNGSGQLLCCDGCVNSFHFSCLNPPLDPANPPEGDWFCPKCSFTKPMASLLFAVDNVPQKDFALPARFRGYFAGVRTGEEGRYEEVLTFPRINPRSGRNRSGRYDDPFLLRTVDAKGKLILCHGCGRTTNGRRPIIQCDFCPLAFHMDCIDPPLAIPPTQKPGSDRTYHSWMCPDHSWHDKFFIVQDEEGYDFVKRIRRPKNPRLIDVEILPDAEEDERIEEQEEEGIMYRVSEKGIKLDFIERVKRENEELAMKKACADRYFEYVRKRHDELTAKAHAFYASQTPEVIEEDTTTTILNSRTAAEREAAANLISFARGSSAEVEDSKISLLIDQLKANAPDSLPSAESEIASLRSLQRLIELRITDLRNHTLPSQSPAAQSTDIDVVDPQLTSPP
ncbi:putative PHD finger domain protein [Aspergillus alliaceus]|uniref:putative PHD finger domain protein n=1 Tax=Petromyces alliaceus TaxID=209559 RepID=UPI0012A3FCE9|nr:uncharacterized protein BDW43DRAFT_306075 [Aspergillus alliaceus]KAB8239192.1 hypothetical protein BDW43DRAFT_306075 [Aspergillus alliaceus]